MKKNVYISYIHSDSQNFKFKIMDKFKGRKYKYSPEDSDVILNEETLEKIEKKISHSDVTVVLISKNIIENELIPLEIRYSLNSSTETTPKGVIGVVIPERGNDYSYLMKKGQKNIWRADLSKLPSILSSNTLNEVTIQNKNNVNYDSFISIYRWEDFIKDFDNCINIAYEKATEHLDDYKITV